MIGMGEIFNDEFKIAISPFGRTTYLMVMYLIYMILSTILLLNLLIAMMNDSYESMLEQQGVTWRVESVQLVVDIEKTVPILSTLLSSIAFRKNPLLILARIAGQCKTASDELYTESNVRLMDEFNVNVEEMWFISLPKERVRETLIDMNETKCCAIQDVKEKLSAIEQSMNSEFVH